MKMGRERDILRWDIHATLLRERIAHLEATIAPLRDAASVEASNQAGRLEHELADLRHRLATLGPSPRAKMG
jgi:hypothetical protein